MPDYDLEAASAAKTTPITGGRVRSDCGTCHRPMYREPYFPGAPSEWRHVSSGQPISWMPAKHLASKTRVDPHTHRFEESAKGMDECVVQGCEAEMQHVNKESRRAEALTERQKATQASRLRGAHKGGEVKRTIPF